MRTKRLLPIFLISVMASSAMLWGQNTYVPDDSFEQALIDLGYDDTLDDYVLTENISGVTNLNVAGKEIGDLTGIEGFTALTELYCHINQLSSLDVSSNTALTYLQCNNNQLTSLNVSNNTALTSLSCQDNQLTSLDVSSNTALSSFECTSNQITALDVSNNTELSWFKCGDNQLTSLDVSSNPNLNFFVCSHNQLTSLDVSSNTALTYLYCVANQLTYLNMKNGLTDQLSNFYAIGNPSLTCIETLDPDYATVNWTSANDNIDAGVTFDVICGAEARTHWYVATTGSDAAGSGTRWQDCAAEHLAGLLPGPGHRRCGQRSETTLVPDRHRAQTNLPGHGRRDQPCVRGCSADPVGKEGRCHLVPGLVPQVGGSGAKAGKLPLGCGGCPDRPSARGAGPVDGAAAPLPLGQLEFRSTRGVGDVRLSGEQDSPGLGTEAHDGAGPLRRPGGLPLRQPGQGLGVPERTRLHELCAAWQGQPRVPEARRETLHGAGLCGLAEALRRRDEASRSRVQGDRWHWRLAGPLRPGGCRAGLPGQLRHL